MFIWSVNVCPAVAAVSRFGQPGVLGIEIGRWVARGLAAILGPSGRLPCWSAGVCWGPTRPLDSSLRLLWINDPCGPLPYWSAGGWLRPLAGRSPLFYVAGGHRDAPEGR